MKLIEKKLAGGLVLTLPYQARSLVKEIWDHQVYNQTYSIRPGDIIFDVGANVGIFSIYAAALGANVYSFEPNPEIFELLQRNIRANGFQDRIQAFNMALSSENGMADLFVANTANIYAEGSASITRSYVADLGKKVGPDFITYRVTCSKLEDMMERLNLPQIDFMKLDCEGAEYEIIQSTPANPFGKIRRISMEIHGACYSQRDFCGILSDKGYTINRMVKATEPTMTGYLDCVYPLDDLTSVYEPAVTPVALFSTPSLSGPNQAFTGETIVFDGSQSFIPNQPKEEPVFTWKIDGREVPVNNSQARFTYQFKNPGHHQVALEVRHDTKTDTWEQPLMIYTPGYFPESTDCALAGMTDDSGMSPDIIIPIRAGKVFAISPGILPHKGFGDIFLSIQVLPGGDMPMDGMDIPWLLFEHNGQRMIISQPYEEIRLENVLYDHGVFFTIRPYFNKTFASINLQWGLPDTVLEVQEGNGAMVLPALGQSGLYRFEGSKLFCITKEMFPEDWTPKEVVLRIQSGQPSERRTPVTGTIICNNNETLFSGWKSMIRLSEIDFDQDLNLTVHMPVADCIRITWWNE